MSLRAARSAIAALIAAVVWLGPGPSLRAESREVSPLRVESAALAVRAAKRRILQHDVERQKRILILKAERIEALRLKQSSRVTALTLQRQLLQQQGRAQASQDRELLQQSLDELRLAMGGTPVD